MRAWPPRGPSTREQGERSRVSGARLPPFDTLRRTEPGLQKHAHRLLHLRIQLALPGDFEHHGEMLRMAKRKLHVATPAQAQAFQSAGRGLRRLGHRCRQTIKTLRRQCCQQFLFIAKMPVGRIVRNSGRLATSRRVNAPGPDWRIRSREAFSRACFRFPWW